MLVLATLAAALAAGVAADTPFESMVEKRTSLRTHSLHMPYVDSDLQNRWWDFGGDAIINTNKHIRLTQDRQSEKGWLWSRMPLAVTNWQIEFEFKVDGRSSGLYGDGFAMWITKERATEGPVFGNQDYFTGVGIFFDTYSNSRHSYAFPRVTAMNGDGKTQYDHEGDNAQTELAACSDYFRRRDIPTKGRLTYLQGRGLSLSLQTEAEGKWTECFNTHVTLPDSPYIGFTAETGEVSDNHDVVSVATYAATLHPQYRDVPNAVGGAQVAMGVPSGTGAQYGRERKRSTQKSGGGAVGAFLFILKAIGVLAFIAFAVAAYRTYSAQQTTTRRQYY